MKLQVTSVATSKKGRTYISAEKTTGETPRSDATLYCVTKEDLYEFCARISHGDNEHREWLAKSIGEYFGTEITPTKAAVNA